MAFAVTVHKSDGNESVGQMWTEVYDCDDTDTLFDVWRRIGEPTRCTVVLTVLQQEK